MLRPGTRSGLANGFTLSEVLIALVILGVIATFTIPKVLQSQQSSQYSASAKEMMAMVSGAYAAYQQSHTPDANTRPDDLTPYMNYVSVITSGTQFNNFSNTSFSPCNSSNICLRMHNGGLMVYTAGSTFGGTADPYALWYRYDEDGKATTGDLSLGIFLYYSGRITTYANILPNTQAISGPFSPGTDPPWFSF